MQNPFPVFGRSRYDFSAMHPADGKPEPSEIDAENLSKLLEIELLQKRAAWQRAAAHRQTFRTFAFVFLLIVIVGAIAAYFFVASQR